MKLRNIVKCTRMMAVLTALCVGLVGCSGGGSSSGSGGSGGETAKVRGNIQSVSQSAAGLYNNVQASGAEMLVSVLSVAITDARADGPIGGIEVCIANACTVTDENGFFTLDISGIDTGMYALTFETGGVRYTMPLNQEISSSSIVIVTDVAISDSGQVTVGDISYLDGDLNEDPVVEIEPDEEVVEPDDEIVDSGVVSGNVISTPETTGNNGNGQTKVVICHRPGTPAERTLTVAEPAVSAHTGHGDTLGACPAE